MRPPRRPLLALALLAAACSDDGTSRTRDVLGGYVAIGASLTAGFASDGLVYDGQEVAYPSQLARAGGAALVVARVAAPGCVPPLVGPLYLGRTLAGSRAFTATRDTSCAGRFADSVFARNVAVPEVTTYQALRYTADSAARSSDPRTRRALPRILLPGYTQVTQALLARPQLVSVELGFTEMVRAVRAGRLVAATEETYQADTGFTYVPFAVWRPWYDSVLTKLEGVPRGLLVTGPRPNMLWALRSAGMLYAQRDSLRLFGVALSDDCASSANYVFIAKVAAAAAASARAGAAQPVSCADVPGAADSVLTTTDFNTLLALAQEMETYVLQAAQARGWAAAVVAPAAIGVLAYSPGAHLAGRALAPFDVQVSLDGLHPDAQGHLVIAARAASALGALYGLELDLPGPVGVIDRPRR